jgi:hypothetical protein
MEQSYLTSTSTALELARETEEDHMKLDDSPCPSRDSNGAPLRFKPEALPFDRQFSVGCIERYEVGLFPRILMQAHRGPHFFVFEFRADGSIRTVRLFYTH